MGASMNELLGSRIKSLREAKGLTQEHVADKMDCSRQKYARLEKGLIDISFTSISTIAQILGIKIEEITSAISSIRVEESLLTEFNEDRFKFISNMLDIFYAHRRLYNSTRKVD